MSRTGPARAELLAAGLVAACAAACSSDSSSGDAADGGGASGGGGTAAASGMAGAGGSNAGGAGGRGAGGRGEGGGSAGGGSPSGGKGGSGGAATGCTYGGTTHSVGSSFPASDGCNSCTCSASGTVACTKRACNPDAGTDAGGKCTDTPAAAFCVHGPTSTSAGEPIKVGDKIRVQVQPRGCFSSSCTEARVATCSVRGTMPFVVDAHFCLESTGGAGVACTADCGGGGYASCEPAAALTAGQHIVEMGGLSVTFTVPGALPVGGECIGSPF